MKICPVCQQTYDDGTNFCLADGANLIAARNPARQNDSRADFETAPNRFQPITNFSNANSFDRSPTNGKTWKLAAAAIAGLVLLVVIGGVAGISFLLNSQSGSGGAQSNSESVNRAAASSAAATTASAAQSAKSGVTLAAYNQFKTGMSYDEAVRIVGSAGTEMSSTEAAGYKTVTVKWEADNFQYLFAVFQNDKLISKTQSNLK